MLVSNLGLVGVVHGFNNIEIDVSVPVLRCDIWYVKDSSINYINGDESIRYVEIMAEKVVLYNGR